MKRGLIAIACTTALVFGLTTTAFAATADKPTKQLKQRYDQVNYTVVEEGEVVSVTVPAYATGKGSVYRDKMVTQNLSYTKQDSGDYYTYVITLELMVEKSVIKSLGKDAGIGCQFGMFDTITGESIAFGSDSSYDVVTADKSGVGTDVYLADVIYDDGTTYTLSSYQLATTNFELQDDDYYHSKTIEVLNVPVDYKAFALVTYGLTEEEHQKAAVFDEANAKNVENANIFTQLSTFIDPEHIAYYKLK